MKSYDPTRAPDPSAWLGLSDSERVELISGYHEKAEPDLPNLPAHATFHMIVETQAAMGEELAVAATLERLQAEGLDRHEAVHAVGSVLAKQMFELMQADAPAGDPNEAYRQALERLTAEDWLRS